MFVVAFNNKPKNKLIILAVVSSQAANQHFEDVQIG